MPASITISDLKTNFLMACPDFESVHLPLTVMGAEPWP
jgi:hypothetical protein